MSSPPKLPYVPPAIRTRPLPECDHLVGYGDYNTDLVHESDIEDGFEKMYPDFVSFSFCPKCGVALS